nr:uncharacterized protein LOC123278918 [Equus asinus]
MDEPARPRWGSQPAGTVRRSCLALAPRRQSKNTKRLDKWTRRECVLGDQFPCDARTSSGQMPREKFGFIPTTITLGTGAAQLGVGWRSPFLLEDLV